MLVRGPGDDRGRDAERLDIPAVDLRQHVHCLIDHVIKLSGDKIIQGRAGALVGHGGHVHLHALLEQQAAQVRCRAQAGIGQVDLALVGIDPGAQLGEVVGRQGAAADDGHRHFVDHADVLEVLERLVGHVAVQRRRCGHADVVQQ